MHTYELRGSGAGMVSVDILKKIAEENDATNIEVVNEYGWENQPKTIRFVSTSPKLARKIAEECSGMRDYTYCNFNAYGVNENGV